MNKNDVSQQLDVKELSKYFIHIVYLSAKESTGVDVLENEINQLFSINEHTFDNVSAANERQKKCIDSALASLDEAVSALANGEMLDAVNILIDEAEQWILSLTGEKITDAVVDEVFSRFCVGK